MNKQTIVQLYKTPGDYAIYRDRVLVRRIRDKSYAFRIAKQVLDATRKIASGPVLFDDFTSFISEV